MAPTLGSTLGLEKRQNYNCDGYESDYNYDCGYSAWGSYGRWILLGCVVVGAFLLFLAFSCLTARRRRRQGLSPYRGTGWAGNMYGGGYNNQPYGGNQYGNNQYGNNQYGANNDTQSPPVYSPPPKNQYPAQGGANQGYFGGQQSGIELQAPGNSYQPQSGGNPVYAAPEGPPPGKGDRIIR